MGCRRRTISRGALAPGCWFVLGGHMLEAVVGWRWWQCERVCGPCFLKAALQALRGVVGRDLAGTFCPYRTACAVPLTSPAVPDRPSVQHTLYRLPHNSRGWYLPEFSSPPNSTLTPILDKESADDKLSVLDIYAIDEHERHLNIEIQTSLPAGMSQRLTYYVATNYVGQLAEGQRCSRCPCFPLPGAAPRLPPAGNLKQPDPDR